MSRNYKYKTCYENLPPVSEERALDEKASFIKVIKTESLFVRSLPDLHSETLGVVYRGDRFQKLSEERFSILSDKSNLFYKISYKGKTGYVLSDYCEEVVES